MPYWSSSRVGAVPVGGNSSTPNKSTKRSLRRGITMEDLKKQTALRLAQEQGRGGEATEATYHAVVEKPELPPPSRARHSTNNQNRRTPNTTPDRLFQAQLDPVNAQSAFRLQEQMNHTPPKLSVYSSPPPIFDRGGQRGGEIHRAPPSQTFSASHSVDSATEKGANAKLPHGLTVHELKEMTKARLEAESVQRGDVGPHSSIPSTVRITAESRDATGVRTAPSPVPPHFYGRFSGRSQYPVDTSTDAWETASVSTSASDYPASESVYSTGLNGNASYNGDEVIPFSRSASYPSNSGLLNDWSYENLPPSIVGGATQSSYFDGFTPNRRRAATLSPRLGLSYVHEDHPVVTGQMLSIPSDFSSPSLLQRQIPMRSRSAYTPEVLKYGHAPQEGEYHPSGVIGDLCGKVDANRPRTLSAASLPMSTLSDDFVLESRGTSGRFSSQFGSVREDAPTDTVAGLTDVFRGSPVCFGESSGLMGYSSTGIGSSLDSFGAGVDTMRMRTSTSSDYGGLNDSFGLNNTSEQRLRAATWAEPSSLNIFCGHDLSDDLASILKLSGAEQSST